MVIQINFSELLAKGSHFEIDTDFEHMPDDEFADLFIHDPEDEENAPKVVIESPWEKKFDELKLMMNEIGSNVYKRIKKEGIDPIPEENVRVVIHYNAFEEDATETFDSTYLRNKPKVRLYIFHCDDVDVILEFSFFFSFLS